MTVWINNEGRKDHVSGVMSDFIECEKEKLGEKLEFLRTEATKENDKIRLAAAELSEKNFPTAEAEFSAWQDVVTRWESIQGAIIAVDKQLEDLGKYQDARERSDRNIELIRDDIELDHSPFLDLQGDISRNELEIDF